MYMVSVSGHLPATIVVHEVQCLQAHWAVKGDMWQIYAIRRLVPLEYNSVAAYPQDIGTHQEWF